METSLSILHKMDVKVPRVKFIEISLILKNEFTWKGNIDEFSTSIFPPLYSLFHSLTFSALATYSKLFWYSAEST